jgi:hypothetical protein
VYGAHLDVRTIFGTLIIALFLAQPDGIILPDIDHPESFYLVAAAAGVALYQRDSPHGNLDFVQLIHLNQGATVQLLHSGIADPGTGQGVYGGDNPLFFTQTLQDVWNDFGAQHPGAFFLSNGQFFSVPAATARLAFPLKIDGVVVSDGYGINQFPEYQLMRMLYGTYRTILIFNSRTARKTEAAGTLRAFGAQKVMMLDGGASAQLISQGERFVGPGRRIPQTIAVVAALANSDSHRDQDGFLSCNVNEAVVQSRAFPICV